MTYRTAPGERPQERIRGDRGTAPIVAPVGRLGWLPRDDGGGSLGVMADFKRILAASAATLQSLAPLEPQVKRAVELVAKCLRGGHKLLACGNGGSASDASH